MVRKITSVCIMLNMKIFGLRIDPALMKEINDHRFSNRLESKTAAIIDLVKKGLKGEKKK